MAGAAENLLEEKRQADNQSEYDVAIVGAGYAGLACALLLGRYQVPTVVFDGGRARNALTKGVHGYLGFESASPKALIRKARRDVRRYSSVAVVRGRVSGIKRRGRYFSLATNNGAFRARHVVIATGVVDVKPSAKNFRKFDGNGAWHCPHCDGLESAGKRLAIIISGARPLSYAKEFLGWTQDITVLMHDGELDNEERKEADTLGIKVASERVVEIMGRLGRHAKHLKCKSGRRYTADVVFYMLGYSVQSRLAEQLGCQLDEGFVKVDESQQTTVPDVYAIGDIDTDRHYVVLGVASGARAAISIYEKLLKRAIKAKAAASA